MNFFLIADCPQILVNSFMDDLGLDQEQAECLSESLSDLYLSSLASVGESEDNDMEDLQELFEAFIGCDLTAEMTGAWISSQLE